MNKKRGSLPQATMVSSIETLMIFVLCQQAKAVSEAVAQRWSVKKVFLKISQNSQENTCPRVSFLWYTSGGCFCSFKVSYKDFKLPVRAGR